jgi:hypothetical protein
VGPVGARGMGFKMALPAGPRPASAPVPAPRPLPPAPPAPARHTGTGIKGYDLSSGPPAYNPPVAAGPGGALVEVDAP